MYVCLFNLVHLCMQSRTYVKKFIKWSVANPSILSYFLCVLSCIWNQPPSVAATTIQVPAAARKTISADSPYYDLPASFVIPLIPVRTELAKSNVPLALLTLLILFCFSFPSTSISYSVSPSTLSGVSYRNMNTTTQRSIPKSCVSSSLPQHRRPACKQRSTRF